MAALWFACFEFPFSLKIFSFSSSNLKNKIAKLSARNDYAICNFWVGLGNEKGKTIDKNLELAALFYSRAAAGADFEAKRRLNFMEEDGKFSLDQGKRNFFEED